uniref:Secreted protein n=1 Tax=Aegilops tauschii subsp. strangulata TaxID=200361 RepID=A0A453MYF6_AEGTS
MLFCTFAYFTLLLLPILFPYAMYSDSARTSHDHALFLLRSSLIRASWTATRHALAAIEQNAAGGRSGDRVPSQRTREYQARHHHQPERRSQVPRAPARQPAGVLHTAGSGRAEETHPPARGCSKEIQPSL